MLTRTNFAFDLKCWTAYTNSTPAKCPELNAGLIEKDTAMTRKKKMTGRIGPFEFDVEDLPKQIILRRRLAKLFKILDEAKVVWLVWDDGPSSIAAQWVCNLSGDNYSWHKLSTHSAMVVEYNQITNVNVRLDDLDLPDDLEMPVKRK